MDKRFHEVKNISEELDQTGKTIWTEFGDALTTSGVQFNEELRKTEARTDGRK